MNALNAPTQAVESVQLQITVDEAQLIINTLAQLPFVQVVNLVPKLVRQTNISMSRDSAPTPQETSDEERTG